MLQGSLCHAGTLRAFLLLALCLLSHHPVRAAGDAYINTNKLVPKPINISIADLPEPFATSSADKRAIVVAVPLSNLTLNAPEGFKVCVSHPHAKLNSSLIQGRA